MYASANAPSSTRCVPWAPGDNDDETRSAWDNVKGVSGVVVIIVVNARAYRKTNIILCLCADKIDCFPTARETGEGIMSHGPHLTCILLRIYMTFLSRCCCCPAWLGKYWNVLCVCVFFSPKFNKLNFVHARILLTRIYVQSDWHCKNVDIIMHITYRTALVPKPAWRSTCRCQFDGTAWLCVGVQRQPIKYVYSVQDICETRFRFAAATVNHNHNRYSQSAMSVVWQTCAATAASSEQIAAKPAGEPGSDWIGSCPFCACNHNACKTEIIVPGSVLFSILYKDGPFILHPAYAKHTHRWCPS